MDGMVYCCVWDVTVVFVALAACKKKMSSPSSTIFEWHECYGHLHAEWWHARNAVKECLPEISCFPSIFLQPQDKKGLTKINGLTLGFFYLVYCELTSSEK